MQQNNNLYPLPFYTALKYQNARKSYAYGNIYPLITPVNFILPFQIIIPIEASSLIISSAKVYDKNNVFKYDILQNMNSSGLTALNYTTYSLIYYPGNTALGLIMEEGIYYIDIIINNIHYYSEMFTIVAGSTDSYIKLMWWDDKNLYFNGGHIEYNGKYINTLYLCSEIGKPEYEFESEGEERDLLFFPEKMLSEKTYKFVFLAPEYMCDAIRLVQLSDHINIIHNGILYECDSFEPEIEWETQGDLASVNVSFQTDTIIKKIGMISYDSEIIPITGISILNPTNEILGEYNVLVALFPQNTTQQQLIYMASQNATISSTGKVTVTGNGNCTITVKSAVNETIMDSFTTAVKIGVKTVTIDNQIDSIIGTYQYQISWTPENTTFTNWEWTSSDPNVATIDNTGKVTVLSASTGRITFTVKNVDFPNVTATTSARTFSSTSVQSVSIIDKVEEIHAQGSNTCEVLPANATNKAVNWSVSDPTVISIHSLNETSCTYVVLKDGICTIICTSAENPAIKDSFTANCYLSGEVPITGLAFKKKITEIIDSEQLEIEYTPSNTTQKEVIYEIEDIE